MERVLLVAKNVASRIRQICLALFFNNVSGSVPAIMGRRVTANEKGLE